MKRALLLLLLVVWATAWAQATQTLKPVLTVETKSKYDVAIANNRVFYRRRNSLVAFDSTTRRTLWRKPAPRLFAAWGNKVFALNWANLMVYDAATGNQTNTVPLVAGNKVGRLFVVGNVLMVSGPGRTVGLNPKNGIQVWQLEGELRRPEAIRDGRYAVYTSSFGKAWPYSIVSLFEFDKGRWFRSSTFLTKDQTEAVTLEFSLRVGLADISPEAYFVSLRVYPSPYGPTGWNEPQPVEKQNLGEIKVGPRPGCGPGDGTSPNVPSFSSANDEFIWLHNADTCGPYLAQISRMDKGVSYLPEPLSLEQAKEVYPAASTAFLESKMAGASVTTYQKVLMENLTMYWLKLSEDEAFAFTNHFEVEIWNVNTHTPTKKYRLQPEKLFMDSGSLWNGIGRMNETFGSVF